MVRNYIKANVCYILNCKLSLDLQNVRPSFRPSVCPPVPLYLLQFLSDSFNIAHRASLQCCGRHGRNFFFGSFSGRFLPFLGYKTYHYISCSFYRILSISHTGHHYNVAGVMEETLFFFRVIFGPFSAIFRLTKASNSKFVKNGKKNLKKITKNSYKQITLKKKKIGHKRVILG